MYSYVSKNLSSPLLPPSCQHAPDARQHATTEARPRRSKIEIANGAHHNRRRMSIDPDKELFDTAAPPPASSPPPAPGGGIDDLSGGRWGGQDGYASDDAREGGGIDGMGGDGSGDGDGGGGGGGTLVISVSWFPVLHFSARGVGVGGWARRVVSERPFAMSTRDAEEGMNNVTPNYVIHHRPHLPPPHPPLQKNKSKMKKKKKRKQPGDRSPADR